MGKSRDRERGQEAGGGEADSAGQSRGPNRWAHTVRRPVSASRR